MLNKLLQIHAMHCWEVTGRVGSFSLPPVSSVFCLFISPAHCMLNVFRCPAFFAKMDEGTIINLAV